jgi:radical SAM superfamily enzyme YgiQ (UPF0313 family)
MLKGAFVMGFPEDSPETLDDSRKMMEELDMDSYGVSTATPFPGTALYKQAVEENLLLRKPLGWNEYIFISTRGLADDPNHGISLKPRNMTVDEMLSWRKTFDDLVIRLRSDRFKKLLAA